MENSFFRCIFLQLSHLKINKEWFKLAGKRINIKSICNLRSSFYLILRIYYLLYRTRFLYFDKHVIKIFKCK